MNVLCRHCTEKDHTHNAGSNIVCIDSKVEHVQYVISADLKLQLFSVKSPCDVTLFTAWTPTNL